MEIYIPTMRRADRQITLRALPSAARVHLVVPAKEAAAYKAAAPATHILPVPQSIAGIAATRQWILGHARKHSFTKIVMMDDDLTFAKRRNDDPTKFLPCTEKDMRQMLIRLEASLDKYAHAGILGREGGNRITDKFRTCMRMMRVYAFNVPAVLKSGARYTTGLVMDDFDMILQLLRKGHPNYVVCDYVQNQPGSNTAGGASTYRTPEVTKATVDKLVQLHAPFVKAVQKHTKTSWGGGTRWDVTVQWKAAYESSKSTR